MKKKVLLVEDDAIIALDEKGMIEKHGYEVDTVLDGKSAVERAAADPAISLVLMDVDLGKGMDGTEAAEEILRYRDLPVVFLSSHTEPEVVAKTEKITSYGYIVKDSGETVIMASIRMAYRLFESKKREEETDRDFRETIRSLPTHTFKCRLRYDGEIVVVFSEGRIAERFNISTDQAKGKQLREILGEDYYRKVSPFYEACFRGETVEFEEMLEGCWFKTDMRPYTRDPSGRVVDVIGHTYEITEQKRLQEELNRKEALYRNLMENSIDAVYLLSEEGKLLQVNDVACRMTGYTEEELLELSIDEIDPNYTSRKFIEFWREKPEGTTILFESSHMRRDGSVFPVEVNGILFKLDGNKLLFGVARDLTERKRTEYRLQAIADYTYDWEDWIDAEGNLVWVNPAVERITGYTPEECFAMEDYPFPLIHPDDLDISRQDIRHSIENEDSYQDREVRCLCKNGSERWISVSWQPIYDANGKSQGIRSSMRDITARKKAEEERSVLSRELHHRVKNNLHMLSSLISLKDTATGEQTDLSDIKHQIDAIRIVHDKLHQAHETDFIDMREYVDDLLRSLFSSFARFSVRLETEIENVVLDSDSVIPIGLILNELATNAVKYGFSDDNEPVFAVSLAEDSRSGFCELKVSNSGKPFPGHISLENPDTIGLRLVTVLVQQLEGIMELRRVPTPEFRISFPRYT